MRRAMLLGSALVCALATPGAASGTTCPTPYDERLTLQLESVSVDGVAVSSPERWSPAALTVGYVDFRLPDFAVTSGTGESWGYCRVP